MRKRRQSVTGAPSPDKRGRHVPTHKLSAEDMNFVTSHIQSLPLVPAHYVRQNATKIYVEGNLNQSRAYTLYCAYASDHAKKPVSKPIYAAKLNELNIAFHQPRKDRCWCTDFNDWAEEDRAIKQTAYDLHIRRKTRAREEKNQDTDLAKTDSTVMTVCFDMQAILFSPMLYNKAIYYKRKLSSYNLTVYITGKREGKNN